MRCVIAIDSTVLGPALGSCRLTHYARDIAALNDALRLSRAMTFKNALANLPFGGGAAVLFRPPGAFDRRAVFDAFGRVVAGARGNFIVAQDLGMAERDLFAVRARTRFVGGFRSDGEAAGRSASSAALGVFIAIEEALVRRRRRIGRATVAIQGLGAVGMRLCERLHDAGAQLVVADLDPRRVGQAKARFGAKTARPERLLQTPCDVLAPCAHGGVLSRRSAAGVQAEIICGSANNQLADAGVSDLLHDRGILYLPDFVVNAAGAISVANELMHPRGPHALTEQIKRIGDRVHELLDRCCPGTPHRVAEAWACEKLRRVDQRAGCSWLVESAGRQRFGATAS